MDDIQRFYDENATQEWERHDRQRMEFAVTMRALQNYLPEPPARIVDIGGGPGRYAIALTQSGYTVTLVDPSQRCLDLACEKAAEHGVEIDAYVRAGCSDLAQLQDERFDAALVMGPMYHLLSAAERKTAVDEALRVLRSQGIMFAAFITRYAAVRYAAKHEPETIIENAEWLEGTLQSGLFRPLPRRGFAGFIDAYNAHPQEIVPFLEHGGLQTLALVACEGVVSMIDENLNELTGAAWEAWVDLNYRLGQDPSVHGSAEHLLYIGRKT